MITFLRNLIFRDFWLKLFSLALAVLIWIIVAPAAERQQSVNPLVLSTTERTWTYFNIPVLVVSAASDVRDFKVSPSEVEVTVHGEPDILKQIKATDIKALVDLTGIESASSLRKQIEVTVPGGVTFDSVQPAEVDVIVPPKH